MPFDNPQNELAVKLRAIADAIERNALNLDHYDQDHPCFCALPYARHLGIEHHKLSVELDRCGLHYITGGSADAWLFGGNEGRERRTRSRSAARFRKLAEVLELVS